MLMEILSMARSKILFLPPLKFQLHVPIILFQPHMRWINKYARIFWYKLFKTLKFIRNKKCHKN